MLGVLLLALSAATTLPSTRPTSIQTMKQQEMTRQLKDKSALRVVGPMALEQAIQITRQDGLLAAHTKVDTSNDFVRVNLGDPQLLCTMRVYHSTVVAGVRSIQLTLDDFSDPRIIFLQTEVFAPPGQLQIVGSWEMPDRERFVTLQERYPSVDEEAHPVPGQITLRVQEMSDAGDDLVNLVLDAPDLASLQREHPTDVEQYVRPILHELHADNLLSVDPKIAWQIFGPGVEPDAGAMRTVEKLLPELNDPRFSQRQKATRSLKNLGAAGAIALMHVDRGSLSAEQRARVDEILEPYHQLSEEQAKAMQKQPQFLIDCLASEDVQLRRSAAKRLSKVLGHSIEFDPDGTARLRIKQLDGLRRRLLPAH